MCRTMNVLCLALLGLAAGAQGARVLRGTAGQIRDGFQVTTLTDMRPEIAAELLTSVENRWTSEAQSLLVGAATTQRLNEVYQDVLKSCTKIANSIVRGSDGDSDKVQEYMNSVCDATKGKKDKDLCVKFQSGVANYMSADQEFDRDSLDMSKFCQKFYKDTITKEAAERRKEDEAAAAKAEKGKAEAAKKQKEADAAAKKAAEKAAKEAKKKAGEAMVAKAEEEGKKAKEEVKEAESVEEAAEAVTKANSKADAANGKKMKAAGAEAKNLVTEARAEVAKAEAWEKKEAAQKKAKKVSKQAHAAAKKAHKK